MPGILFKAGDVSATLNKAYNSSPVGSLQPPPGRDSRDAYSLALCQLIGPTGSACHSSPAARNVGFLCAPPRSNASRRFRSNCSRIALVSSDESAAACRGTPTPALSDAVLALRLSTICWAIVFCCSRLKLRKKDSGVRLAAIQTFARSLNSPLPSC